MGKAARTVVGRWVAVWRCKECKAQLTYNQKMYSDGVCPFCGEDSGDTIVNVVRSRARCIAVELRPWWAIGRGPQWNFMYEEHPK